MSKMKSVKADIPPGQQLKSCANNLDMIGVAMNRIDSLLAAMAGEAGLLRLSLAIDCDDDYEHVSKNDLDMKAIRDIAVSSLNKRRAELVSQSLLVAEEIRRLYP
jgi:hypothetical protein